MKTKKQKLTLKKTTIANLNGLELASIRGGQTEFCQLTNTDCKQCQIETDTTIPPLSQDSACYTQTTCMTCDCPTYNC